MKRRGMQALLALIGAALLAGALWVVNARTPMPAVTFATLDGRTLAREHLRGKVLLINFWATTCTSCIKEMPMLVRTHQRHRARGFETIAVAMDYDPPEYVARYVAGYDNGAGLPFTVVLDRDGSIARAFEGVRLTPTTFIVNRRGELMQKYLGEPDEARLNALIETLLAEPG